VVVDPFALVGQTTAIFACPRYEAQYDEFVGKTLGILHSVEPASVVRFANQEQQTLLLFVQLIHAILQVRV